jgi:DNA-binding transcriptional LysR family regulator
MVLVEARPGAPGCRVTLPGIRKPWMYSMRAMHLDGIDITQVRLLASLIETRNLSAAAARMGLSQSAASHALAKLRQQVGDPLFVRSASGVQLTPYGERLCSAARQAVDALLDGLASNHPFDPQTATRRFNVYLNDVGQLAFLPKLLEFMQKEAPGSSLKVHPIPMEHPGVRLASGEVDIAAGFFTNLTSGFHQSLLYRVQYVCVVRAGHPKFKTGMTLDAFLATPHAVADPSGMAHAVIEQALAKHRIHRVVKLGVPDFVVLPLLIADSDLLVIMPGGLAKAFSSRLSLKILPPPVPLPRYDLKVYWHERFHRDPANRWLRQVFVDLFRSRDQPRAWARAAEAWKRPKRHVAT